MEIKNKLKVSRGEVGEDKGGLGERVVKEQVKRTQGQSRRVIGSRVAGGDGWVWGEEWWRENGDNCT